MYLLYRVWLLILLSTISFADPSVAGKDVKTVVRSEGSIPPARILLACIHELDNKPFSDPQIKDCVGKLTANHFIRDVEVHTKETEDGRVLVEFVLHGESLTVDELRIDAFDKQQAEILKHLSLNDNNLRVGGTYSWPAESSTYEGIRQFYRVRRKLVGIVPKLRLDYTQGKAWVSFTVIPGPTTLPQPLIPPYDQICKDRVTSISWWGTGDEVPVELVESNLGLASVNSCFTDELAQRDRAYLSTLTILSAPRVDYSGSAGSRHVEFALKARPLRVAEVDLRGFGDLPSDLGKTNPSILNSMNLKAGEFFSHSAATKSAEYLKKAFSRDGYWVEVAVQEELSGTDKLLVTFSVLVFPLQTIIVDGKEIR
jgi:hypothetical protein